jgi:hypothetical protein
LRAYLAFHILGRPKALLENGFEAVLLLQEAVFGVQANRGQTGPSAFQVPWVSRHLRPLRLREEVKAIHRYVVSISPPILEAFGKPS